VSRRAATGIRLVREGPSTIKLPLLVLSNEILNPTALVKENGDDHRKNKKGRSR
jgi:hypothetical protein